MRSSGRRSRCLRYEQKGIKAFLKVDRLAAARRGRAGRRMRKISGRETAFSTRWGVAVATVPPAVRNQVSILLPNTRRIFLDNLVVLDYGTAGGDFRVFKFVNRGSLPLLELQLFNRAMRFSTASTATLFVGLIWILSLTTVSGQKLSP